LTCRVAGQGYEWRAVLCIARRSGVIAMRNLSSRVGLPMWAFVAAGGTGGVAVPLADGRMRVGGALGCDAGSGMAFPFEGGVWRRPGSRVVWAVLANASEGGC
jgi:hypothetical protein